jgi:hypothetical protein
LKRFKSWIIALKQNGTMQRNHPTGMKRPSETGEAPGSKCFHSPALRLATWSGYCCTFVIIPFKLIVPFWSIQNLKGVSIGLWALSQFSNQGPLPWSYPEIWIHAGYSPVQYQNLRVLSIFRLLI